MVIRSAEQEKQSALPLNETKKCHVCVSVRVYVLVCVCMYSMCVCLFVCLCVSECILNMYSKIMQDNEEQKDRERERNKMPLVYFLYSEMLQARVNISLLS